MLHCSHMSNKKDVRLIWVKVHVRLLSRASCLMFGPNFLYFNILCILAKLQ